MTEDRPPVRGLYAIADMAVLDPRRWLAQVEAALAGGARLVQYRDKAGGRRQRLQRLRALVALAREHGVPVIANDDPRLAAEGGAAGVHLGRDDPPVGEARALLGPAALIGASCYDDLERAAAAARAGADYLAFGSFFPSPTKPGAVRVDAALLGRARRRFRLPLVAIGGITPDNAGALLAAGADALAVISGLFAAPDPQAAAARYAALFPDEGL